MKNKIAHFLIGVIVFYLGYVFVSRDWNPSDIKEEVYRFGYLAFSILSGMLSIVIFGDMKKKKQE